MTITNEKETKIFDILKKVPNKFMLSLAVSKRARQLAEGAKPLIPIAENEIMHPILTALEEIHQGKIVVLIEKEKDEDLELIEEVDRFFDEQLPAEEEVDDATAKKLKKDKDKESKSKKTKSLAA